MKKQTKKQVRGVAAMAVAGLFLMSACATTSYVPRKSGMIKIMPKGYQKDDEFYRRGYMNRGLLKAVEGNEEAMDYAKRGRRNQKLGFGLLWGGVSTYLASVFTYNGNRPNSSSRNVIAFSLLGVSLASIIASIFPAVAAGGNYIDAINKYNDDILERIAPQVFTEPAPKAGFEKSKPQTKEKSGSAVITVPQEEETSSE